MAAFRKAKDKFRFPDLPSSLRSDSVEINDLRKRQAARLADASPYIHPYLGLRARLSQIWINRWTVLLLLVLVRVLLLIGSLNDNIGDAKIKALSACTKVEDIGSAMASMPHYLSVGVNDLSAKGIEKVVHGLVAGLQLAVTVIENLILFVINMMTSTYVCLATTLIHGSLEVTSEVIKKLTDKMNDAIDGIADGLSNDAKSFEDGFNKVVDGIEGSVFGGVLPDLPDVKFVSNSVDKLKNLDIDTSGVTSDIDNLNKNIPTFDEVKNFTDSVISSPFKGIKSQINQSFGSFVFDRDIFPVAQKQQLTFCSDNDRINEFFGKLYETAKTARIVFIVLITIAAILACAPMAWLEIRRWRRQQKHARMVEQSNGYDPMDIIYISSRPTTASWGVKIASRFSGKRQILARWACAYATTLPAIFVLSLALAGFFSALCQFIMLKSIEKQVPELAQQVGAFAEDVVGSLEDVSKSWARDANNVIIDFNNDVNNDMLGWVQDGTDAVNNTLNTFTEEMNKAIENLLGDTVLKKTAEDIIRCIIGLKVEAVQKGLTWLHDQAHVDFPLFADDTFSLGAQKSISEDSDLTTFLASPSSVTTDEVTGAVKHVTDALYKGMIEEVYISIALLLLYIIVVMIGVMRMLVGVAMPEKTRAEGGIRPQYFAENDSDNDYDPKNPFDDSAAVGYHYAQEARDEKTMHSVQEGKAAAVRGHARGSSYAQYDSANKF